VGNDLDGHCVLPLLLVKRLFDPTPQHRVDPTPWAAIRSGLASAKSRSTGWSVPINNARLAWCSSTSIRFSSRSTAILGSGPRSPRRPSELIQSAFRPVVEWEWYVSTGQKRTHAFFWFPRE